MSGEGGRPGEISACSPHLPHSPTRSADVSGQSGEMSLPPDERKVRDPMKRRTKFVAVAAAFAVASGGGVAYALWSANGSGPGQTKA